MPGQRSLAEKLFTACSGLIDVMRCRYDASNSVHASALEGVLLIDQGAAGGMEWSTRSAIPPAQYPPSAGVRTGAAGRSAVDEDNVLD